MESEYKISILAMLAHSVNMAYCKAIGEPNYGTWAEAPAIIRDGVIRGVQLRLANRELTPKDMHEAWMADKLAEGWVLGEKKDPEAKTHPNLVPYDELPVSQRVKDYLFSAVIDSTLSLMSQVDENFKEQARKHEGQINGFTDRIAALENELQQAKDKADEAKEVPATSAQVEAFEAEKRSLEGQISELRAFLAKERPESLIDFLVAAKEAAKSRDELVIVGRAIEKLKLLNGQ